MARRPGSARPHGVMLACGAGIVLLGWGGVAAAQVDAITDLAADASVAGQVTLTWTGPREDLGILFPPQDYEIRLSTLSTIGPITEQNWTGATLVPHSLGPPLGQFWDVSQYPVTESLTVPVAPNEIYWFAVKWQGSWSLDWSPLSNVVIVDRIAPAPVGDLAIDSTGPGRAALSWTSPGDMGGTGSAWLYEIRYAPSPITDGASFDAARPVGGVVPKPAAAGLLQSAEVTLRSDGSTYWFAVRAYDQSGNWSLSDPNPSAAVPPEPVGGGAGGGGGDGGCAGGAPNRGGMVARALPSLLAAVAFGGAFRALPQGAGSRPGSRTFP